MITELFIFSGLILGLLVGSFLNVVAYRLPLGLFNDWHQQARDILEEKGEIDTKKLPKIDQSTFNIAFPPSHCTLCKSPIKPWHNIPVFSYFFLLKGKCNSCNGKISIRYPIVELITGILSAFIVWKVGVNESTGLLLVFTWTLITLSLIDFDHKLLPDNITLPLLWLGLLANSTGIFTNLNDAVIGAAAGYLSLWTVSFLFKVIRKKEGMGHGDFKLLAALGAWMGWQSLSIIILLSAVVGAVVGIGGILLLGKDKNIPIPFGPFLATAGWVTFFWSDQIFSLVLQYLKTA